MAKILKIGIVGCGAIGSSLAKAISRDFRGKAVLVGLFDMDVLKASCLSELISRKKKLAASLLESLIKKSDLVIEAASGAASWEIAQKTLESGCNIMIMSVGGIVGRYPELLKLSKKYNAKVYLPSGAISGIDALKASVMGEIKAVTLTTSKNPLSFKGVRYVQDKGINLGAIKKERVLFNGTAKDAVKYFPQNINVAAVLSLAGIGAARTRVRIIANPAVSRNIHEIEIISGAGTVYTRTENVLHPENPKTSYLAFLSAVATLKQILEPVKIGT
ncbi:MAG: aspartate dehydrogenase [Candidatus Omnitrophica bacterium]|jgi:aspartate dehydrogenase|nr:aspartate dehydrogenase [Candidatus Omnitrophota bacterium]